MFCNGSPTNKATNLRTLGIRNADKMKGKLYKRVPRLAAGATCDTDEYSVFDTDGNHIATFVTQVTLHQVRQFPPFVESHSH